LFTERLQELFINSKKYIQNLIIKIITKIYLNENQHSFRNDLLLNMNSKEFIFINICIKKGKILIFISSSIGTRKRNKIGDLIVTMINLSALK